MGVDVGAGVAVGLMVVALVKGRPSLHRPVMVGSESKNRCASVSDSADVPVDVSVGSSVCVSVSVFVCNELAPSSLIADSLRQGMG